MAPIEDGTETISWTEIDARIDNAIRAERAIWRKAMNDLHIELLQTLEATISKALDTAEASTAAALQQLLNHTAVLLEKFDSKVRAALAEDRRLLDQQSPLRPRNMN
jgi:hypothetical protein